MQMLDEKELETVTGGVDRGPCFYYQVKQGETLEELAQRYNTTVDAIKELNPSIGDDNKVYARQNILIPLVKS